MRRPFPRKLRFFFPLFFLLVFLALGGIVYKLWNAVLVEVVAVKTITYWQAVGLLILSRILLGGFRFGPSGRFSAGGPGQWREKWRTMNDDERARIRSEWKRRCESRR